MGSEMDGPSVTLLPDSESNHVVIAELSKLGPVVSQYSIEKDGKCYDLHDHYSKPRILWGIFVRSPVEALINLSAFVTLAVITGYAAGQAGSTSLDWWTLPAKLVHLLFHCFIHVIPNFSEERGLKHMLCPRILCGIIFGLARYWVLFVYAWRIGRAYFIVQCVVFAVLFRWSRFAGELVKTALSTLAVCCAMWIQHFGGPFGTVKGSGHLMLCVLVAFGTFTQLYGSGAFYLACVREGGVFKEWKREHDRRSLPYHVASDFGNALFICATSFVPHGQSTAVEMLAEQVLG